MLRLPLRTFFFGSIEASRRIGRWSGNDQREVAILKLTDYGLPNSLPWLNLL